MAQVTVIIAAFNAEATLDAAIASALAQTVPVEVVIVDDCSTDGTLTVAKAWADRDPRVCVFSQPVNSGPSAARNRAIAESDAPWIAVLDSDDRMEPDRLASLIKLADSHSADFVADDLWKLLEGAAPTERTRLLGDVAGVATLSAAEFVAGNLSARRGGRSEMGFLKPLMSRKFLELHELSYANGIRLGEDYVLYAQSLMKGARFLLTEPAGYLAIVRPGSLSGSHPTEAHTHLVEADRAMLAEPDLSRDLRQALKAHQLEQRKKLAWRRLIDAVREAKPGAALRCFFAPPAVMWDLTGRLVAEVVGRVRRRVGAG